MALDDGLDDDTVVRSTDGKMSFHFGSKEGKQNFLSQLGTMVQKSRLVREEGLNCGQCAAYPCFRHTRPEDSGLCFQAVRQCRQECDYFLQDLGSGKAPEFQITGTCNFDKSKVNYQAECHIPEVKEKDMIRLGTVIPSNS